MECKTNFYNNGIINNKSYYNEEGKLHNLNGPALIDYREDGTVLLEVYYVNGVKCNPSGGPVSVVYNMDGIKVAEEFKNKRITYHENQNIESIYYYDNIGQYHNPNGPAVIDYKEDGTVIKEEFYIDGKHKEGAAIITYNADGTILEEKYFNKFGWYMVSTTEALRILQNTIVEEDKEDMLRALEQIAIKNNLEDKAQEIAEKLVLIELLK